MESLKQVEKNEYYICYSSFAKYFIYNNFNFNIKLANICFEGKLDNEYIRPHSWKLMLSSLSCNIVEAIKETNSNRKAYKKMLKLATSKKIAFSGDPLGGYTSKKNNNNSSSNSTWETYHHDNDLKKIISLDINRTYQDYKLFNDDKVKENLVNLLYIWSKENQTLSYKQGMNEILAVIYLSFYPFYFPHNNNVDKESINKIMSSKQDDLKKADSNIDDLLNNYINQYSINEEIVQDIYSYFHNESNIYADIYYIYDNIMNRGIKELYDTTKLSNSLSSDLSVNRDFSTYKAQELFQIQWKREGINCLPNDKQLPLQRRCNDIAYYKLKYIDSEIYEYLNSLEIDCSIFLQRYIKCLFNREVDYPGICVIWDCIIANEMAENIEGISEEVFNNLNMIDYIASAMIIALKNEILYKDQNECFMKLFKYPDIKNPSLITRLAVKIKESMLIKKGKRVKETININNEISEAVKNIETYASKNELTSNNKNTNIRSK